MKTTKVIFALAATASLLAAPSLFASYVNDGQISLSDGSPTHWGNGGTFGAVTTPAGGSYNFGNFQTFCIEESESIGLPGGPYFYQINTGAVKGGNGGVTTTDSAPGHTGFSMDNISFGTAFLYSQFRAGAFGALTASQAGQLQNAIWYLEDEINGTGLTSANGVDGTSFYNLALAAAGNDATAAHADSLGAYGVVALNLFNGDGSVAQDQLAIVPEASSIVAGVLLLLPLGASTIRILRKSRTA